jgi:hypothetical protein
MNTLYVYADAQQLSASSMKLKPQCRHGVATPQNLSLQNVK